MTSNMIYIVALGAGLKCPRKIHLNSQCQTRALFYQFYHVTEAGGNGVNTVVIQGSHKKTIVILS